MESTITLNARGFKYQVLHENFLKFPNTRLGRLRTHLDRKSQYELSLICDNYNLETNEFYFDRDPFVLNIVLNLYKTDRLHINQNECASFIREELVYWQIDESLINSCCQIGFYERLDEIEEVVNTITKLKQAISIEYKYELNSCGKLRKSLWELFDKPKSSILAKVIFFFTLLTVTISVSDMIIQSLPGIKSYLVDGFSLDVTKPFNCVLDSIQLFCLIWSVFEISIRIIVCPNKLEFFKSPLNIIDIVAILPFILWIALAKFYSLSVIKVLLLFKISRYSDGLKLFGQTLKKSIKELGILLLLLLIGMIIFSTFIYYCEFGVNSKQFSSIPASFWWSIITMTTVGYGDVAPITGAGKFFGVLCAISGLLFLALPIGIIASNFSKILETERRDKKLLKLEKKKIDYKPFGTEIRF